MMQLALAGMQQEDRPALVIVDPHGDMATQLYGTIGPEERDRVRVMDLGDEERALTFNPLDPNREGWDVEATANAIVDIGKGLWGKFWGPRMQDVARHAFQALAAANEGRSRDDLLGLSLVASLLSAPKETQEQFLKGELQGRENQAHLLRWFLGYYQKLRPYTREEVTLSVHRFQEKPMLPLLSSPKSVLDIGEILQERKILIINTRKSHLGADVSDFVGSLLINVLLREIARQGEASPEQRAPVMVIVDEFQTFTGVPWQEVLGETRKYGGRFVIGTQNFASLGGEGADSKDLRGQILGAVHPLFAFHMNGEDAHYLAKHELGAEAGGPGPNTLTNLEPYRAYLRLVRDDGSVTQPFYFESAPPPTYDDSIADRVWKERAGYSLRYEEALSAAREMMGYLDGYSSTVLSQGDMGPKRHEKEQPASSYEVQSAMLDDEGDDRAAGVGDRVRRALDKDNEVGEQEEAPEDDGSIFDRVSRTMLDLLEGKLTPEDDDEPEGGED